MAQPAKVVVLSKELRGQSFELHDKSYIIGRVESADICIPDSTISSRHAELRREDDEFELIDLESANGTRVNGERISSHPLRHSDVLQVGEVELMFDNPNSTEARVVETRTNISLETNPALQLSDLGNLDANYKADKKASPAANRFFLILAIVLMIVVVVMAYFAFAPT